jgi:acyl-CoA thioester hydrolase
MDPLEDHKVNRPREGTGSSRMNDTPPTHEIIIRVRYAETDRMGFLHHAQYFVYFEQARTEMLRAQGASYKEIEDQGFFLVVFRIDCTFRQPAKYDDLLCVRTTLMRTTAVRIEHRYEVFREESLVAEGSSVLACVDRQGRLQPLPEVLRRNQDNP